MQLKVQPLSDDAHLPVKAHETDAAFDLAMPIDHVLSSGKTELWMLHIAVEVPPGWYGQIQGRSSTFMNGIHVHPGIIDAGYRGEVGVIVCNVSDERQFFRKGDRIAQLLILPVPEVEVVLSHDLSASERGVGGFGSTGA